MTIPVSGGANYPVRTLAEGVSGPSNVPLQIRTFDQMPYNVVGVNKSVSPEAVFFFQAEDGIRDVAVTGV